MMKAVIAERKTRQQEAQQIREPRTFLNHEESTFRDVVYLYAENMLISR